MALACTPIGVIRTIFPEKFGTPRQSGLVAQARGKAILPNTPFNREGIRGLEGFSHIWLIFGFHQVTDTCSLIKPPRMERGRVGVFATRSPHRPNHLGLSAVKLEEIIISDESIDLHVAGHDIVDETPLFDIKPYLEMSDAIRNCRHGWRDNIRTEALEIQYPPNLELPQDIADLIHQLLLLDPRPKTQKGVNKVFDLKVAGYQVLFSGGSTKLQVLTIKQIVEECSDEPKHL